VPIAWRCVPGDCSSFPGFPFSADFALPSRLPRRSIAYTLTRVAGNIPGNPGRIMLQLDTKNDLRITTAPGLAPYVEAELNDLGHAPTAVHETSVELTGSLRDCMALNLRMRTAISVLYLLKEFPCTGPEDLYTHASTIAWEDIIPPDGYICVDSRGDHPSIDNWMYVNQRVKDAVVDRMQDQVGARPSSGPERHGIVINTYWRNDYCWIYLNTSGGKLSDRGYRRIPFKAPMTETLAAGVVLASGYDGSTPFVNPMCGSGTLAIEAALLAANRAPGLLRSNFGLMHIRGFDEKVWKDLRVESGKQRRKAKPAPIVASDISPEAVSAAKQNAKTAGVDHLIEFHVCDFADTPVPPPPGVVIMNAEYGQRMGDSAELERTYKRIGDFLKKQCQGYVGCIFTGNRELAKRIGLRTSRKLIFWNAKIECRLLKYELYAGTREKSPDTQ